MRSVLPGDKTQSSGLMRVRQADRRDKCADLRAEWDQCDDVRGQDCARRGEPVAVARLDWIRAIGHVGLQNAMVLSIVCESACLLRQGPGIRLLTPINFQPVLAVVDETIVSRLLRVVCMGVRDLLPAADSASAKEGNEEGDEWLNVSGSPPPCSSLSGF